MNLKIGIDIYTLPRVGQIAMVTRYKVQEAHRCSEMTQRGWDGGGGEGVYIYMCMADSLYCTAEINTTL